MDVNMPEEIQEKLKIIEKEADFSPKLPHPTKWWIVLLGAAGLLMISVSSAIDGDYFETLVSVAVAIFLLHMRFIIYSFISYIQMPVTSSIIIGR